MQQILWTAQEDAATLSLRELKAIEPSLQWTAWLEPGVGLAKCEGDFATLGACVRRARPVFVRHLCPVQAQAALSGDASDVQRLVEAALSCASDLTATESFSVQTRMLGYKPYPYKRFDINEPIAHALCAQGFTLDVRTPAQAVSVTVAGKTAYVGVSYVADNRSDWAGGCRRFAYDEAVISRAEFKLLEALEVFALPLPEQGTALDLGAAPGGWTHVLRMRGLRVLAVDPALLDPRVRADEGVTHVRETAQAYFTHAAPCEVIVNDMKMDTQVSAALMVEAASLLAPRGLAVMTLKLPKDGWLLRIHDALQTLATAYDVLEARQLFHNRSEITVALRKRAE